MRAIFIGAGVTLIQEFHWVIYIFGALLILTGIKMALQKDKVIVSYPKSVIGAEPMWVLEVSGSGA